LKSEYGQTSDKQRSVNLLDFSVEKERELYMLDIYSDQSQFGGLSKTELKICSEDNESFLRLTGTLTQE
jgi:hypothetical protein